MAEQEPFRDELTPVAFLERAGTTYANRVAVVDGGSSWTWAELRAQSRQFAMALRRSGLRRGDRVAFLALNSATLLLAHFGVLQAGGVLVAINTRLTAEEVAYIIMHSESRSLFFSSALAGSITHVPTGVARVEIDAEFDKFLATADSHSPIESWLVTEDELCAIDYTSGTTGRPKGVMYSHRGAYLNSLAMALMNQLSINSTMLWTLPMFHCNGWSHTWAMAASGCKSICVPRIDPPEVWRLLDEQGVTHLNAAPTVLIMLAADAAAHRLNRPVRVCTGGAPPSPTLIRQMASLNINLSHLYGLTESYGPLTINVPPEGFGAWEADDQFEYQARQGFPHMVAGPVRVVDPQMHDVPADGATMGEVVARGNTLMTGYYKDPDATEDTFAGGWLHTGDLAVLHADRSIELRDRKKDIIISGGENISTIEVEQAIATHPAVLEVAVVPKPDPKWGEVPHAFVTLKPGHSASDQEIIEHVRSRIAHFKAPRTVVFGELPKTSTGKIQKYVLRDKLWVGQTKRIN